MLKTIRQVITSATYDLGGLEREPVIPTEAEQTPEASVPTTAVGKALDVARYAIQWAHEAIATPPIGPI